MIEHFLGENLLKRLLGMGMKICENCYPECFLEGLFHQGLKMLKNASWKHDS